MFQPKEVENSELKSKKQHSTGTSFSNGDYLIFLIFLFCDKPKQEYNEPDFHI
jgi:hypothetical protein